MKETVSNSILVNYNMAVCGLRTLLLIVCILELIVTVQRQVFDFLGFMWLPIIANFMNILLIIFGSFGAVQYITKYLLAYSIWSCMWLTWNIFLICYYLNLGTLNRESGLLSLGTGSVSWWEGNGWGCQSVWGEIDGPGSWRPVRVEGCLLPWEYVELAQSSVAALFAAVALPLTMVSTYRSFKKKPVTDKKTLPRRPVYTIELSPTETTVCESSVKPMTPRRVKRRSGSRGNNSSVRRSRRSYRNAGYLASTASLPRDGRPSRPTSAHSSYSNFHAARPSSYHAPERETHAPSDVYDPPPPETVPIRTGYDSIRGGMNPGYDVVGPYSEANRGYEPMRNYEDNAQSYDTRNRGYESSMGNCDPRGDAMGCESPPYGVSGYGVVSGYGNVDGEGWQEPPPPAPPYSARATPQAPGPPAYQASNDNYY